MHRQSWSFSRLCELGARMSPSSQKRKPRSREVDDSRDSAGAPSQTLFPTLSPRGKSGPGLSPCLWQLCHRPTARPGAGLPQPAGLWAPHTCQPSPTAFLWQPGANNQLVQLLCWLLQARGEARTQANSNQHRLFVSLHLEPQVYSVYFMLPTYCRCQFYPVFITK